MRLIHGLIYSNVFVAFVLSLLTSSSYAMIHRLDWHWYVPTSIFLGSFVLYTFHRLYKIDFIPKDRLAERHQWVLDRSEWMKYAMSLAVFAMMLILPNFAADTIVWLVPAGIISVGYTIPLIPSKHGWRRLRDIPLTKPLIISIVVSYLTVGYPLFEQFGIHSLFNGVHFSILAERVLFLMAMTIPFDARDIVNDADAGLDTIGTHYGFNKTRQIAILVFIIWLALMVWRIVNHDFEAGYVVQLTIVGGCGFAALLMMRTTWSDIRYILVFEGMIIVYALSSLLLPFLHSIA